MTQLQVNQFSHGLLNPGLGWLLSCLGSFVGLRCLTRARAGGSLAVRDSRPAEITQPDVFAQQDVFGDVFTQAEAPADVPRE